MTTLQKTFVTAVLAAAVATPLVRQHHANTRLRDENSSLRQQLAQQSQAADERLAQLQAGSAELDRLRQDHSELARLRADVSRQRARQPQPKTLPDSTAPTGPLVPPPVQTEVVTLPKDSWSDAGFDTPRAALKTRGWTVLNGNRERFKQSLFVTDGARKRLEDMFVQLASASTDPNKDKFIQEVINQKFGVEDGILMPLMALNQQQGFTGYRVLSEKSPAEGEAILEVETQMVSAPAQMESLKFRRFDNEWKVVIDEDAIKPH